MRREILRQVERDLFPFTTGFIDDNPAVSFLIFGLYGGIARRE